MPRMKQEFALHGDWEVYYRDNAAPDSVLAPGDVFEIRYSQDHDIFSVKLAGDPDYQSQKRSWSSAEVAGTLTLSGNIEHKRSKAVKRVTIYKIRDHGDLLPRDPANPASASLDQLSIRVDTDHDHEGHHTDPGHSHADR